MITLETLNEHVGEEKLRAMVGAFYQRVKTDPLIGKMYPADDWTGSEKRLADFLVYRFGGPQTYLQERGHPRLRMRHLPFSIGISERDQWLKLMGEAMRETGISEAAAGVMIPFFAQVADMMRNRPE
jgi:hemoglobin